jgi:hypothetical protein
MHDIVSPVGLAWNRYCNDGHSKDDLYYDTAHPTHKASYLNGAVIFATIFKTDPTNINYTGGYADAQYLRQIAWETVTEASNWAECNMPAFTPEIHVNGNVLSTDNVYSTYQWYELPEQITGANEYVYSVEHSGIYFVEVTDANLCKLRSKAQMYGFATNINNKNAVRLNIYPNPVCESIIIDSDIKINKVEILDMKGRIIKTLEGNSVNVIDIPGLNSGEYIVRVNNIFTHKIIVKK